MPAVQAVAADSAQSADASCKASPFPAHEGQPGTAVQAIQARGYVNIGVDLNDFHWGFLGPDGNPQGFDIDIATAIAQSLPGHPKIHWVAVDDGSRIPRLNDPGDQHLDFVVHTMTINCDRRQRVDMSTVYFEAGQRVLIPKGQARDGETGQDAMTGKRVCVAGNSTADQLLTEDMKLPKDQQKYHAAALDNTHAQELDCLVQLQLGHEDAILTDDAIAFGLAAQDPATTVVGDRLTDEPYGVATGLNAPDLASWINQVLEEYRTSGAWETSYKHWIKPFVPGQADASPPPAQYTN
jgi:polar amino acid transport system substrate-binding protein